MRSCIDWKYLVITEFKYFYLAPMDCIVSQWSTWSPCRGCGRDTMQTRTRTPVRPARFGGKRCGPLKESRYCQTVIPC